MKRQEIFWWLSLVTYLLGLLIFLRGFLLNRVELHEKSRVNPNLCSSLPKEQRLILLLVDALGYDFLERMPFLRRSIKENSHKWKALKFIADPPTTTMQRLKALLTGSMPTFIDAKSNFGAEEVSEDSVINQWLACNRTVFFTGDDTWEKLFPNRFTISDGYPSFNVRDLDSVDRNVESFIRKEINSSFSVMIGHLLGIDHAGHTFGKFHPEMSRKIDDIDKFIEEVTKLLGHSDTLVIIGDHGMTSGGNHGGDTFDEIEAAMLVHDKRGFTSLPIDSDRKGFIYQVDLIPYLSLLTKISIPFSNLGVLPVDQELIPNVDYFLDSLNVYCSLNNRQITDYSLNYLTFAYDEKISESTKVIDRTTKVCSLVNKKALQKLQEVYRENWTKMDLFDMLNGIIIFAIGLMLQLSTILSTDFVSDRILTTWAIFFSSVWLYFFAKYKLLLIIFLFFFLKFLYHSFKIFFIHIKNSPRIIPYFMTVVFFFGNSFIIQEMSLITFLLNSLLLARLMQNLFQYHHISLQKIFLMILLRLSQYYEICREESLENSYCQREENSADGGDMHELVTRKRFLSLIVAIACSLFILKIYPKYFILRRISLNDSKSGLIFFLRRGLENLTVFFLWLGWILKYLSETWPQYLMTVKKSNSLFNNWILRVKLDEETLLDWKTKANLITLCCLTLSSIILFFLRRNLLISNIGVIPKILKLTGIFYLLIIGADYSMALAFHLVTLTLLVHCDIDENINPVFIIFDMYLIGKIGFFTFGHQRTITSIPWLSIFNFYNESPKTIFFPAVIVLINLTISHILTPIVFFCVYNFRKLSLFRMEERKNFMKNLKHFPNAISFDSYSKNMLKMYALNILSSTIGLTILRRHLMVWKIFTPAFLYEFIFFTIHQIIFIVYILSRFIRRESSTRINE